MNNIASLHQASPTSATSLAALRRLPLVLALAAALSPNLATARDIYWLGGTTTNGVEGRWSDTRNWEKVTCLINPISCPNGTTSVQPAVGDALHFKGSKVANSNDLASTGYAGITFESGAAGFTLTGVNNLGLGSGGIRNLSSNAQRLSWDASHGFVINEAQTWDGGTAGLTVTGGTDMHRYLTLQNNVTLISHGTDIGSSPDDDVALTITKNSKLNVTTSSTIAVATGTHGLVTVQGAGSSFSTVADLVVGDYGDAQMYVSAGGSVSSNNAYLGKSGGSGSVTITGAGSAWANAGTLYATQGDITVDQGGAITTGSAQIGNYAGTLATLTVKGTNSLFTATNKLSVGQGGLGVIDLLPGGTVQAQTLDAGSGATINLRGGNLVVGAATIADGGAFNFASGTLEYSVDATNGAGTLLGASATLAAGSMLKADAGFLVAPGTSLSLLGGAVQAVSFQVGAQAEVSVGNFSTLTAGSINNAGTLTLAGGRVSGALVNDGYMSGSGYIAGTGGFRNTGLFDQSGFLEMSNSGNAVNTGTWNLLGGKSLTLRDSKLSNYGTLNFDGATVLGAGPSGGTLLNGAGGTITGSGTIRTIFQNDGRLIVQGGTLAVNLGFQNNGQILMSSVDASLSGSTVTNWGRIEGLGQVSNVIVNNGSINAKGGTLALTHQVTNSGSAILTAGRDATLLLSGGMAPNTGKIQLAGGTLDVSGALVNDTAGTLSGFGDVRSGLLTNNGKVQLSGGVSAVYSDVLGTAGSQVILSGNSNTTFYGKVDVQSGAELRVSTGSVATFFDLVSQRTGAKFTGSGAKRFEGGLSVGASPGLGTDEGDVEFGEDNVYLAEIGGTTACTLACASNNAFKNSSFDKYMVAGNLSLNGTLKLTSWNGFVAKPGQHFDLLDWGSLTGTFAAIDAQGLHLAAGSKLDFSQLYTTGEISVTAVPEPSTYALWLAGLSLLPWLARRRPGAREQA